VVLGGVAPVLSVDVVADPVKGQVAVIAVADDAARRPAIEAGIHERMKAFSTAYRIEWAA
jgi:hypothetical protein